MGTSFQCWSLIAPAQREGSTWQALRSRPAADGLSLLQHHQPVPDQDHRRRLLQWLPAQLPTPVNGEAEECQGAALRTNSKKQQTMKPGKKSDQSASRLYLLHCSVRASCS